MKPPALGLISVLFAPFARAQTYDLTTPITPPTQSVVRYRVEIVKENRLGPAVNLLLSSFAAGDVLLTQDRWLSFTIPSPAGQPCTSALTINGYAAARGTAASGEPSGAAAKQNYRIIDYLRVQGCFPAGTMSVS